MAYIKNLILFGKFPMIATRQEFSPKDPAFLVNAVIIQRVFLKNANFFIKMRYLYVKNLATLNAQVFDLHTAQIVPLQKKLIHC